MSKAAELANLIGNINAGGGGVNRNVIINGAMQVAQRSTSETNPGGGYNVIDRFRISQNGGGLGNFTEAQVADAPSGSGLTNSLKFTKSGSTSIASGTTAFFQQNIEGQNLQHLKYGTSSALPVTASFYVKSSLTGTFGINLEQNGNSRHNVQTYTISSANTWELKSVTFVGDTASALANDNTNELSLRFVLGAGSDYQTSSTNTWAAGDKHTTSSQVQLVETDGATFFLTGVQLEVGQNPTSFEHIPFEKELLSCRRYYHKIDSSDSIYQRLGQGQAYSNDDALLFFHHVPEMRGIPTLDHGTLDNLAVGLSGLTAKSMGSLTIDTNTDGANTTCLIAGDVTDDGLSAGNVVQIFSNNNSNGYIAFKAEL